MKQGVQASARCKILPLIISNSHSSSHTAIASVRSRIHPSIFSISSRPLNGRYQFPLSTLFPLCSMACAQSPFPSPPLPLPPPASHLPLKSHIPLSPRWRKVRFWPHVVACGEGSKKEREVVPRALLLYPLLDS